MAVDVYGFRLLDITICLTFIYFLIPCSWLRGYVPSVEGLQEAYMNETNKTS